MNQDDDDFNQKIIKIPNVVNNTKNNLEFFNSISKRNLGIRNGAHKTKFHMQAKAEDELIKKQFKELRCEMPGMPRSTFLMVFSPDGTKVASTHGNHNIYVSDVRTGKHIKTLVGHPRTPWCIAFHPSSNQIIGSGCLGGQVRIWDLSGGSEVWTVESQTVIASIAFHPDDRLLVIATYNELHFWDWSKPEPFMHVSTSSAKEKVRYVAFDQLGHKLITGITNSPQTRWERVRAPVPVLRPADNPYSPYRRRITPRLVTNLPNANVPPPAMPTPRYMTCIPPPPRPTGVREPLLSSVPERERRITTCYRDLVQQYEVLVHRYLQIYRPPVMIDQGTDPMEMEHTSTTASTSSPQPSTSTQPTPSSSSEPSTSQNLRKSSATLPAKNKSRRFFKAERLKEQANKTISSTQTVDQPPTSGLCDDIEASLSSSHLESLSRLLSPSTSNISNGPIFLTDSSSSSDEDDKSPKSTYLSLQKLLNERLKTYGDERKYDGTSSRDTNNGGSSAKSSNSTNRATSVNASTQRELANNMNNLSSSDASSASVSSLPSSRRRIPSPSNLPSTSTQPDIEALVHSLDNSGNTSENISVLIRNAEMMITKFRENLQDLQGIDLPSTSASADATSSSSINKSKPSKGTSTNDPLAGVSRKRVHPQHKKINRRPILDSSSDMGSSDEEQVKSKKSHICPESSCSHSDPLDTPIDFSLNDINTTVPNNTNSSGTDHSYAESTTPNEHSYAGMTDGNSNDTVRIHIDLSGVDESIGSVSIPIDHNNTNTPNTSIQSDPPRRQFFSHRLSAFYPTRLTPPPRTSSVPYTNFHVLFGQPPDSSRSQNFAQDEVINYSERVNEDESSQRSYHPFDPPPEISINSENVGIGSMYSNIVHELESSLNDVRSIRANHRLDETSGVLTSFTERLDTIMSQSNAILRNLTNTLDSLPSNSNNNENSNETNGNNSSNTDGLPRWYRSLRTLGMIMRSETPWTEDMDTRRLSSGNPINSDHTYPLNPENPQTANMSPLMVSLHLTVSHIQRQARLLRSQVESIERIDRAMLEVAQLQMMRQMFDELHRHFSVNSSDSNRIGVSSVRQMMAGTRISDSSPYDSPTDEGLLQTQTQLQTQLQPQPHTSSQTQPQPQPQPSTSRGERTNVQNDQSQQINNNNRSRARRPYPRTTAKERVIRRNIYRRFLPTRANTRPSLPDFPRNRTAISNLFNPETLPSMTRRLEHYLMEHGRYIGRTIIPPNAGSTLRSDVAEHMMMLRLNNCRQRINVFLGINEDVNRNEISSVNVDGTSRFGARQALSSIVDCLSRHMEYNSSPHMNANVRSQIWEVIELSLLLSEILLLQIVDSIPPPTGMNLDPERESLSLRIDQMCSRMLQNRLSSQSQQLTRSLRLLRLTVRHATLALGQTYTARRNAMLPSNDTDLDSRQGLLDDIHNCLRNIRRHRENSVEGSWFRTINDMISRIADRDSGNPTTTHTAIDDSSDENTINARASYSRLRRTLYRTSNVNLLNNEESSPAEANNRGWNVPIVQVNDVPLMEPQNSPWHPRFVENRQRLSERLDELRTTGGLFRPRFLHPLYTGGINPFEPDWDDHRDHLYDTDIITTVTPNHRIQVWEFSKDNIPNIREATKNVVVRECKIHNDASVDYATNGTILVTLLPSGGYMNITNRLGVYSLDWKTLGQCLYLANFEQNAVSVSLSPLNRHLIVGLASRRVSIMPSDRWTMARIFKLEKNEYGKMTPIRDLEQNRDTNYMSVNCIRWMPNSGEGLVFATNTGHLRFLT
ncbi:PREDICTED: uncharacterized protein LOC108557506 isoform X2 [Nicrophorus vespilloides]|uniref:Uncharacterized protein LOC108557506 isoform X2 n=1 Tax=Nicrophorus vespilloides TaxID=110193 RepID=A0ABM1M4M2_NICVS|nr:PREDICTED: uncharacterized protein LOC108557506 isoform X2 [Nicrophorus vespilloides]